MRWTKLLAAGAGAALVIGAGIAAAPGSAASQHTAYRDWDSTFREVLSVRPSTSPAQARATALTVIPGGTVSSVERRHRPHEDVWEVDVLQPDGRRYAVMITVDDGRVIGSAPARLESARSSGASTRATRGQALSEPSRRTHYVL